MKNKKLLILGATAAMTVALVGTVVAVSQSNGLLESRASESVTGSIVFSRSGGSTFTKIDDHTASVSGRTANGATYYAVSHNIADISETNYVAQFGTGVGTDEQYVSFSTSPTGTDDFEFQSITGIKVHTVSGPAQTMYLRYSTNGGETFNNQETISASSSPDKYTFSTPHQYVRLVGYATYARNVTSIELFYSCSVQPVPVPSEPDHIYPSNPKTSYEYGDAFVRPKVYMVNKDETYYELTSGLTFSGYDPEELGDQTITVTYDGPEGHFETSYTVNVYIPVLYTIDYVMFDGDTEEYVNIHDFMEDVDFDSLPASFEEGKDVELEIILSDDEYETVWLRIQGESWWDFDAPDGVHFTLHNLPYKNITLEIIIASIVD